jgi:predicted DNA-binding protein with PD1-like motif
LKKITLILNIKLLILFQLMSLSSCLVSKQPHSMKDTEHYVFRLKPGMDLKKSIQAFAEEKHIKAGWIVTCVGSLTTYSLRFANQTNVNSESGHFEMVSLTGTVSENGSHLHLAVSDSTGKTIGGHLADGNIVYTTAEIVVQCSNRLVFRRENDGSTPWQELKIEDQ